MENCHNSHGRSVVHPLDRTFGRDLQHRGRGRDKKESDFSFKRHWIHTNSSKQALSHQPQSKFLKNLWHDQIF